MTLLAEELPETRDPLLVVDRIAYGQLLRVKRTESEITRLFMSLWLSTQMIDHFATNIFRPEWEANLMGINFGISRRNQLQCGEGAGYVSLVNSIKAWLHAHEEAQVMMASVLVVIGLWWLVRVVLSLIISLVCPLIVVLLAVVMVPQLRAPLLGRNYTAVADILHNVLITMAENIKKS